MQMGSVELKQIENLLRRIHAGIRLVLWIVIWTAIIWWLAWWIISSNAPRSSIEAETMIDQFNAELTIRSFRLHDVRTLLITQLGLFNSRLVFATDEKYGSAFLFQALPFIVVAICSYGLIELNRFEKKEKKKKKKGCNGIGSSLNMMDDGTQPYPRSESVRSAGINKHSSMWSIMQQKLSLMRTYPLVVKSPFFNGVLTAAEVLIILTFLLFLVYTFGRRTYFDFMVLEEKFKTQPSKFKAVPLPIAKLGKASYNIARTALIPFALLWIPVSRGSPFLRILQIPFERAVRYHAWLATIMVSMLTLHGAAYIIFYATTSRAHKIISWETDAESCSVVAGVAALSVGLTMAATAHPGVRRTCYELFLYLHVLLSPLFFILALYHAVWALHFFVIPVLLFFIDRFLRFLQSRRVSRLVSARILHENAGAMELHIPLPGQHVHVHDDDDDDDLDDEEDVDEQSVLSSWYLCFPSVSKLQWHMFSSVGCSTASSPTDRGDRLLELTFIIKPVGNWTRRLKEQLVRASHGTPVTHPMTANVCPMMFSFKAGLEGPYGYETNFYLKYNTLVLIGGGIGITPLLAVLRDLLVRYGRRGGRRHGHLPKSVKLYHCVRHADELSILNSVDPNQLSPNYEKQGLSIRVFAYVTAEPRRDMERGGGANVQGSVYDLSLFDLGGLHYPSRSPEIRGLGQPGNEESSRLAHAHAHGHSHGLAHANGHGHGHANGHGHGHAWARGNNMIGSRGEPMWVASTMVCSIVGFYVLWGVSTMLMVRKKKRLLLNYEEAQVVVASMLLATLLFGGFIVLLWDITNNKKKNKRLPPTHQDISTCKSPTNISVASHMDGDHGKDSKFLGSHQCITTISPTTCHTSPWCGTLQFGCRPPWTDIFKALAKEYRGENIGVIVSGPQGMQLDVAKECKRQTKFFGVDNTSNVFHYHSVSFEI